MNPYIIVQNPNNDLWYVAGYTGINPKTKRKEFMVISEGFKTRKEAFNKMQKQIKADAHARKELVDL